MDRSKTIAPAAAALGLGGLAWAAWHCFFPVAGVAAVGTTNEAKLLAARRGLAQLPVWRRLTISGVKVPSGVADMPQDLDETMRGASNRACAALAATPTAAIGVGLESGIFRAGGHTFDVCCCCIRVRETQTDSFGFGSSWQMPASVAERLEDPSVTLDVAWETLVSDADPTGQGLLGQLSGGVTTRSTCERTLKSEKRLVVVVSSGNASGPPDRLLAFVLTCSVVVHRHTRIGADGSSCDNPSVPQAGCKVSG